MKIKYFFKHIHGGGMEREREKGREKDGVGREYTMADFLKPPTVSVETPYWELTHRA